MTTLPTYDVAQLAAHGMYNPSTAKVIQHHYRPPSNVGAQMPRYSRYGRKTNYRRKAAYPARRRKGVPRRKGFQSGKASKIIIRQPSGIPDRCFVKLVYADEYSMSSTTGGNATQVFRGNSIFDPDLTGTGHQPYWFDQWSQFYQNYVVHGSSIKIIANPTETSTANTSSMTWTIYPHQSTTAPTANTEMGLEMPYSRSRIIGQNNLSFNTIKHYMSTRKIIGGNKRYAEGDPNFRAAVSANPAEQWYWIVNGNATDLAASVTNILIVRLVYYVEFFGRTRVVQS